MTDYQIFLYLKKRNYLFLIVIFIFFSGCKTKYATKDFIFSEAPSKPDYSKLKSWAAHPKKNDSIIDISEHGAIIQFNSMDILQCDQEIGKVG